MKKIKLYGGSRNRDLLKTFTSVPAAKKYISKLIRIEKGFQVFVSPFSDLHVEINGAPSGGYYYSVGRKC